MEIVSRKTENTIVMPSWIGFKVNQRALIFKDMLMENMCTYRKKSASLIKLLPPTGLQQPDFI